MKTRLDRLIVDLGLADSREKAQALIMAGEVRVNGQKAVKSGQPVAADCHVEVLARPPYVSHEEGTQLVIGYIEKFWCPTITSADIIGGERFKFANAKDARH